jgi:hypothetical protein
MAAKWDTQGLVDEMLDEAEAAHPGVEYAITLAGAQTLVLPRHSTKLEREVNGREGAYNVHVYRDSGVTGVLGDYPDWLVSVGPVVGTIPEADKAKRYYGDLRSGTFSTELPALDAPLD